LITAIISTLQAVPEIIKLFKELHAYLNHLTGGDISGYIRDSRLVISELKDAKTPEQKLEAAKKVQNLIAKL
jgi:hypothetical protein